MQSAPGQLLSRAAVIEAALEAGYHMTLADVTVEEFRAVQALREERINYQVDLTERQQRQAEFEAARNRPGATGF